MNLDDAIIALALAVHGEATKVSFSTRDDSVELRHVDRTIGRYFEEFPSRRVCFNELYRLLSEKHTAHARLMHEALQAMSRAKT